MPISHRVLVWAAFFPVFFGLAAAVVADEQRRGPTDPFSPNFERPPKPPFFSQGEVAMVEHIAVSTADFLRLTDPDKPGIELVGAGGGDLRGEVQKLVGLGRAEVLEMALVKIVNPGGLGTKIESGLELIYGSSFEPADGLAKPFPAGALKPFGDLDASERDALLAASARGFPTTKKIRQLGTDFDFSLYWNPDGTREFWVTSETVQHVGWQAQTVVGKISTGTEMPKFFTRRTRAGHVMRDGEIRYIAAFPPAWKDGKSDPAKRMMVFAGFQQRWIARTPDKVVDDVPPLDPVHRVEEGGGPIDPFAPGPTKVKAAPEWKPPTRIPVPKSPFGIIMELEAIQVPLADLSRFLYGYRPAKGCDDTEFRDRVGKLVSSGRAEVVEHLVLRTRPGVRVVHESTDEVFYSNSFRPQGKGGGGDPEVILNPLSLRPVPGGDLRKVGTVVIFEPSLSNGAPSVYGDMSLEMVQFLGMESRPPGGGGVLGIAYPRFYREAVTTGFSVPIGGCVLLAVTDPGDEDGESDLPVRTVFFLRANFTPPER